MLFTCDCSGDPNHPVDAMPEVAGIGLMFAFVTTAVLTFMSIFIGWLMDFIPDERLNCVDDLVAKVIRKILCIQEMPGSRSERSQTYKKNKARRIWALERFVLGSSDQQLVTGLAMLLAGFLNLCTIDWYHFQIVSGLVWCSSTIHLSTLVLIRDYLSERSIIRRWRVTLMCLTLIGLIAAQVFNYGYYGDNSAPTCCTRLQFQSADPINIGSFLALVVFLVRSYGNKFTTLYSKHSNTSMVDWGLHSIEQELLRVPEERRKKLHIAPYRIRYKGLKLAKWLERPVQAFTIFSNVRRDFNHSFLNNIFDLFFGLCFGIISILTSRSNPGIEILGNENDSGFGGTVALLLTLLTIVALYEMYYDTLPMHKETDTSSTKDVPSVHSALTNCSSLPASTELVTVAPSEGLGPHSRRDTESGLRNTPVLATSQASEPTSSASHATATISEFQVMERPEQDADLYTSLYARALLILFVIGEPALYVFCSLALCDVFSRNGYYAVACLVIAWVIVSGVFVVKRLLTIAINHWTY